MYYNYRYHIESPEKEGKIIKSMVLLLTYIYLLILSGQEPSGSGRFLVLQILFFFHFQPFFEFIVLKGPNGS